ncbi:hypothetical protein GW17_00002982 [Ensete ventricosum]|nr:hypothetical protein GW17_00002982 [Ensete ventricosum]
MTGAMKLQPDDEPRSSLGIRSSSDDAVGSRRHSLGDSLKGLRSSLGTRREIGERRPEDSAQEYRRLLDWLESTPVGVLNPPFLVFASFPAECSPDGAAEGRDLGALQCSRRETLPSSSGECSREAMLRSYCSQEQIPGGSGASTSPQDSSLEDSGAIDAVLVNTHQVYLL